MPRPLTEHERSVRDERGREHITGLREGPMLLAQLRERAGIEADRALGTWMSALESALETARDDPDPHAIVWWIARVGRYVGNYLVEVHAGHWYLDENPEGRTFLRSVVGGFGLEAAQVDVGVEAPRYDPFRIAATVFAEHLSLTRVFGEIEAELAAHMGARDGAADAPGDGEAMG